jgi:hypothetical protein
MINGIVSIGWPPGDSKGIGRRITLEVSKGVISYISVRGTGSKYELRSLIQELGTPDTVLIHVATGPLTPYPFAIVVRYEQGLTALFLLETDINETKTIASGCVGDDWPYLALEAPAAVTPLREYVDQWFNGTSHPPLSIEEASGYSKADFAHKVGQTETDFCVETSIALWQ